MGWMPVLKPPSLMLMEHTSLQGEDLITPQESKLDGYLTTFQVASTLMYIYSKTTLLLVTHGSLGRAQPLREATLP